MAVMIAYDSNVLQKFADKLYARARKVVFTYALMGFLLGGGLGFAGFASMLVANMGLVENPVIIVMLPSLLFMAIGYVVGVEKSFHLRLQAQTVLCQAKIEENTRK